MYELSSDPYHRLRQAPRPAEPDSYEPDRYADRARRAGRFGYFKTQLPTAADGDCTITRAEYYRLHAARDAERR